MPLTFIKLILIFGYSAKSTLIHTHGFPKKLFYVVFHKCHKFKNWNYKIQMKEQKYSDQCDPGGA